MREWCTIGAPMGWCAQRARAGKWAARTDLKWPGIPHGPPRPIPHAGADRAAPVPTAGSRDDDPRSELCRFRTAVKLVPQPLHVPATPYRPGMASSVLYSPMRSIMRSIMDPKSIVDRIGPMRSIGPMLWTA